MTKTKILIVDDCRFNAKKFQEAIAKLADAGFEVEVAARNLQRAFSKTNGKMMAEELKSLSEQYHLKANVVKPEQPNFTRFQNKGFRRRGK
jgi:thymidine kinase